MPAILVDIDTAPAIADPQGRERALRDAYCNLVGDIIRSWRPGSRAHDADAERAERARTLWQYPDFLERRVRQLERAMRSLLDAQATDRRSRILGLLYGPQRGKCRDPRLLTPAEMRLFECYRGIDTEGKQLLRILCRRLVRTSAAKDRAQDGCTPE